MKKITLAGLIVLGIILLGFIVIQVNNLNVNLVTGNVIQVVESDNNSTKGLEITNIIITPELNNSINNTQVTNYGSSQTSNNYNEDIPQPPAPPGSFQDSPNPEF